MWTRRREYPVTSQSPGRRWRKHPMRFESTSRHAARSNEENDDGDGGGSSGGGSRRKPPKEVSLTDPQATWVARPGVDPFFAYDANYLIDNKAGIIVDAEGTRANRTAEIAITETMVNRVGRRFNLRPQRLAGDTVYGAVRLLKWLVDRKITPHIPVWDRSTRFDGTFSRADFVFDQERNIYVCPGGAELTSSGNIDQGHIVYYRASKNDCSICFLKPKCTTAVVRKVTRDLNEDVRDRVRALANTEAFQQSSRERKKIEMRFAHMKRIFRLDRLRLRGLSGARDEVFAHRNRAEPEAARQLPLPCPTAGRNRLPGVGVASGVGADASMPQLPRRESGTRHGRNSRTSSVG